MHLQDNDASKQLRQSVTLMPNHVILLPSQRQCSAVLFSTFDLFHPENSEAGHVAEFSASHLVALVV
jgi:hypothetical protein